MLLLLAAAVSLASPASAHIGSPNVFYEGDAGPYHLIVTVTVPQVIPGVATVDVRAPSGDVRHVATSVTRLTGAGSNYAPVPDQAHQSSIDPRLFSSSVWLMEYGSLRVLLNVDGARGAATMSVPVPSFARKMLPMPRWLGAILLALTIALGIGAVSIVGAAARDSTLAEGSELTPEARRRGRRAMAVTAVIVCAVYYGAFVWWSANADNFFAATRLFQPPDLSLTLDGANRLQIRAAASNKRWLRYNVMEELVPDHGHLMHLFLVRTPGLDRLWHLHPSAAGDGAFAENLPAIEPGSYKVFADVVDRSGFPWTLVGNIDLPQISGPPLTGDDSSGSAAPLDQSKESTTAVLDDGTRVLWQHDAIRANVPMLLRFVVQDKSGAPARDLEPYMGMAAHAVIVAADFSVFAHIHPSGSVPMAAVMMAGEGMGATGAAMNAMDMPATSATLNGATANIPAEISMPYGFPKPGRYRIFFQFKRAGQIETATFDADVI